MKLKRKAMSLDMTAQRAKIIFHNPFGRKPAHPTSFHKLSALKESLDEAEDGHDHDEFDGSNRQQNSGRAPRPSSPASSSFWGLPIRRHMSVPCKMPSAMMQQTMTPNRAKMQPTLVANMLHIVTHYYKGDNFSLEPGDRVLLVDNGDPDWKHGFKSDDGQLGLLLTFPSTSVAPYEPNEQPMRVVHNCHLAGQNVRLYRDQIVFVQPDSLSDDGFVVVRNEHGKFGHCSLHMLAMA